MGKFTFWFGVIFLAANAGNLGFIIGAGLSGRIAPVIGMVSSVVMLWIEFQFRPYWNKRQGYAPTISTTKHTQGEG